MITSSNHNSSSGSRLLLGIIALSVILRIGSAVYQGTGLDGPGVADQISYHELAVRVANGHGFSFGTGWWPATKANQPTAHWSFLYVLFLAAIYSVVGPAPIAVRLIQAVLVGVLHPFLTWRIGRRLFGPAVGLVSAAIASIYGYFVFYAGALVTESLYVVAMLWALDISIGLACASRSGPEASRFRPWVLLGLALAASALLRQAFVLVVPFVLAWLAWQLFGQRDRDGGRLMTPVSLASRLALTSAVLLMCILPWSVRNYRAFGQFVLLNTNAGFVFFWGNHPIHGTAFIPILPTGPDNYGSLIPRELRRLNEAQLDRELFARGLGFVKADPERYVRLSISRAKEYFKFWPSPDSGAMSNFARVLSFGLLAPFLMVGVLQVLSRVMSREGRGEQARGVSGAMLLLLVATIYTLVHLLTWTLVRYRLPVDAITMPFAAFAMVALFHRMLGLVPVPDVPLRNPAN